MGYSQFLSLSSFPRGMVIGVVSIFKGLPATIETFLLKYLSVMIGDLVRNSEKQPGEANP